MRSPSMVEAGTSKGGKQQKRGLSGALGRGTSGHRQGVAGQSEGLQAATQPSATMFQPCWIRTRTI